ncbi:hypothetical protein [Alkalicoccus luteus]|uniref:hypothetical protein n=1 Tax=Alkalicoccus luteus TaxID=1237094 RepID=UPI0031B5FDFC
MNNFEETLNTYIIKNELSPTGFRNFRIISDEVYSQTVRVRGQIVHEVVKQELFIAYSKELANEGNFVQGSLITLCRKDDSFKVKNTFEARFNVEYEQYKFDVLRIIEASADVRNANFDVNIETVNGVSMRGTRVHNTQYYEQMLRNGDLKAVMVNYDMPEKTVTFRVSVEGNLLLYSSLSDYEILELVEILINLQE